MSDDDLRDRFAAHALAGYLAAFSGPDVSMPDPVSAAVAAYGYAEAMLAERESSRTERERERALRRAEERARIEDAQRGPRP